jgi:hypothetical protein
MSRSWARLIHSRPFYQTVQVLTYIRMDIQTQLCRHFGNHSQILKNHRIKYNSLKSCKMPAQYIKTGYHRPLNTLHSYYNTQRVLTRLHSNWKDTAVALKIMNLLSEYTPQFTLYSQLVIRLPSCKHKSQLLRKIITKQIIKALVKNWLLLWMVKGKGKVYPITGLVALQGR